MDTTKATQTGMRRRRSQRIPLAVPLLVSSLDPQVKFSERCETVSVSKHGCVMRAPQAIPPGTRVRMDIPHTNRATNACVVHSEPTEPGAKTAQVALELEKAENFWGLQFPPDDWAESARIREREIRSTGAIETPAAVAAPPKKTPPPVEPSPPPQKPASISAAPPPAPAPAAPTVPKAAPPSPRDVAAAAEEQVKLFEALLREKARAISTDFENSYRTSLGDLLHRLRADLEEHSTKDWERLHGKGVEELRALVQEARQQTEQELASRQQAQADTEKKLQAVNTLREQVETQLKTAGEVLQEQMGLERKQFVAQTRDELQGLVEEFRQQVNAERAQRDKGEGEIRAVLEEVRRERDYVESLIRHLPQTVNQQVQQGVGGTLENIRHRLEEEFSNQREEQVEQLEEHLRKATNQVEADIRQKLFEDLDRNEREFLDRINVRLEEIRSLEEGLRRYVNEAGTLLAQRGDELLATLRSQLQEELAQRQGALKDRLEHRSQELNQRAEQALRTLGEQTWGSLKQKMMAEFDGRQRELRQDLDILQDQTNRLEGRAEELALRLDIGLVERLDQAVQDTVERARQMLDKESEAAREKHVTTVESQLDHTLAPLVSRAEAAGDDLHQMVDTLEKHRNQLAAQSKELQETLEKAQAWSGQEKQAFEKIVHDALVEASGQLKGRIHLAVEMAQEPMERRARQLQGELDERTAQVREELARQVEETRQRIQSAHAEAEWSVDSMLKARLGEAEERFRQEADQAARDSSARLQANLNEALETISRIFREKLSS